MELQWLRRERQRGRGAITRLSLWRHLLVVASRHRLVCVNRTTELSGWTWSLTFPPAPASNNKEDNDDQWTLMLKSLRRRQSWTNILHWSSKFSWTLAFENTWHLTWEFFVRFISEDSAKYRFIQLWWEPLSRILAHWKQTHFHTYTKIHLCLDFSANKVTLNRFLF